MATIRDPFIILRRPWNKSEIFQAKAEFDNYVKGLSRIEQKINAYCGALRFGWIDYAKEATNVCQTQAQAMLVKECLEVGKRRLDDILGRSSL